MSSETVVPLGVNWEQKSESVFTLGIAAIIQYSPNTAPIRNNYLMLNFLGEILIRP